MSRFKEAVIKVIQLVPKGKVVSYGQVAVYVGVPRAARQVGWILRTIDPSIQIPWWRVINNAGRITIKGNKYNDAHLQKKLLESEGVEVNGDFTLDIKKHRFIANDRLLKKFGLPDDYVEYLHTKYFKFLDTNQ